MKKTTLWIIASTCLIGVIYAMTPGISILANDPGFWTWRNQTILLTGIASIVLMSVCMLIAIRPAWLDRMTGGLDKAYGLHKWLGITIIVTLLVHWLAEKGPKWIYSTGWLPPRIKAPRLPDPAWYEAMRDFAKIAGEWAFYAFIVLAAIALLQRIPYRYFRFVHKLFPVIFLGGAYHAVLIQPREWWSTPAAYMVVTVTAVGVVAALISLTQRIGASRTVKAEITQVDKHDNGMVDVFLEIKDPKGFEHKAGQFAFITFTPKEGPHPYTISSSSQDPRHIRFSIKALGDYTSTLASHLQPGQTATLEGPYGQFDFAPDTMRQVWVAGGIGVTPFMARLEALALNGDKVKQPVDFWYCTSNSKDAAFPRDLEALCQRVGVTLHRMRGEQKQFLNAGIVRDTLKNLENTTVWFCGPAGFASSLKNGLKTFGFSEKNFHNERFNMR